MWWFLVGGGVLGIGALALAAALVGIPSRRSPGRPGRRIAVAAGLAGALAVASGVTAMVLAGVGDGREGGSGLGSAPDGGSAAGPPVVAGYYPRWAAYEDEANYFLADAVHSGAADRLTHLVYGFSVDHDTCTPLDPWGDYQWPIPADHSVDGQPDRADQPLAGHFNQLRKLKERYPDLTVLLSLGGGGDHSAHFPEVAATPERRAAYVSACLDTYLRGNLPVLADLPQGGPGVAEGIFDGIELDWAWPTAAQRGDHAALVTEFRRQLDAYGAELGRRFSLTITLPSVPADIDAGYEIPGLFGYVDYAMVSGVDMYAPWNEENLVTNHQAQLYDPEDNPSREWGYAASLDDAVDVLLEAGAPAGRLVLIVPGFGHVWHGVPEANNGLYQTGEEGELYVGYDELIARPGISYLDEEAVAAYRYDGDRWASFDNPDTIAVKAGYVRERALAGLALAGLDGDPRAELVTAIADGLTAD